MSKPEMQKIAEDALAQISCAMANLDMLEGVLNVLKDRLEGQPDQQHYKTLIGLAIYNVTDWHDSIEIGLAELRKQLQEATRARVEVRKIPEVPR